MFLIESSDDRLVRQIRKENTLSWAIVIHAKAFVVRRIARGKGSLTIEGFVLSQFMNYSG
jgi:hypothetical protein